MSASPADLANRLNRAGNAIGDAPRSAVTKACQAGKGVMLAALTSAVGGTRLRGVGAAGARVGVRYRVFGTSSSATGILQYTGPVHLVNSGTSPHEIEPRRKKALAPSSRAWAAARVEHPGTRGRDFAGPAERVVLANAKRVIDAETRARFRAGFGV